uniref:NAD-dependent epimerase/dehydratase domain-containing protein n=1 Tax=Oryza barthii TaxID=65489 RepID=A0A0D3H8M0_9ORYZ
MPADAAAKGMKLERYASGAGAMLLLRRAASGKVVSASSHLLFRATVLATMALVFLFTFHYPSLLSRSFTLSSGAGAGEGGAAAHASHRSLLMSSSSASASAASAGEAIAHTYNHIYGLSITGLRFFTVYGPWGRPDMAYFFFAKSIVSGEPITLFRAADGADARRDFTYIDDVVKGCLGALDTSGKSTGSSKSGKKSGPAPLRVYNLGNTSPVPVTRMVAILEKLLGKKANKRIVAMPSNGDVPFTHANVTHAAHDFGYRPTTSLDAGLRHFVDWFADYYKLKLDVPKIAAKVAGAGKPSSSSASKKKKKAAAMSASS